MCDSETYSLSWGSDDLPGISWLIRSIRPDGSFFGCIHNMFTEDDPRREGFRGYDNCAGCGTSIMGVIPEQDLERCRSIIRTIAKNDLPEIGTSFGAVGLWRKTGGLENAKIIYRYQEGDECTSGDARLFLELIETVERQVSKHYGEIDAE